MYCSGKIYCEQQNKVNTLKSCKNYVNICTLMIKPFVIESILPNAVVHCNGTIFQKSVQFACVHWQHRYLRTFAILPFIKCNTELCSFLLHSILRVHWFVYFFFIQSIQQHLFLYEVMDICFELSQHISVLSNEFQ